LFYVEKPLASTPAVWLDSHRKAGHGPGL